MSLNTDKVLTELGQFGLYQKLIFLAIGLAAIPAGYQTIIVVFVGAKTDFRCVYNGTNLTQWSQNCTFLDSVESCDTLEFDRSVFTSTIRSQWGLVCERDYLVAMVQTVYMLGWLVGVSVLGYLSDRFGRKKILVTSLMILCACSVAQSFNPNLVVFMILRTICGAMAGSFITSAFVISVEMVGVESRVFVGTWIQGWWALGFVALSGVAYGVRDHRYIQLIGAVPLAAFVSFWWILPESLRWLLSANRRDEAEAVLNRIATVNGKPQPDLNRQDLYTENEVTGVSPSAHVIDLIKTSDMRRITGIVTYNWFVVSFVYYGLTLNGGELGGNLFLNVFLSGMVELPSYILVTVTVDRVGRVRMLAALNVIGGVACLGAALLMEHPELHWLLVTVAMIGKFAISASFAIIYIYSAEVFPTSVRNMGLALGSMAARVGGLTAPQIIRLDYIWRLLPFLIFAIFPIIAGLLEFLLPETLGRVLPSSIDQVSEYFRNPRHTELYREKKTDVYVVTEVAIDEKTKENAM